MKSIKTSFLRARIGTKMQLSYITILVVSVSIICLSMYLYASGTYKKQLLYSTNQAFLQAEEFVGYRVNSVIYVSDLLQVNQNIQDILGKEQEEIQDDIISQNEDMRTIEKYIYSICNSMEIYQVSLYVPEYLMYSKQNVLFRSLNEFQQTKDYEWLKDNEDVGVWLKPEVLYSAKTSKTEDVISFLRIIRGANDLSKTIGVQRVSIRSSDIVSIMEKSSITKEGLVWIENSRGELIACSNEERYKELKSEIAKLGQAEQFGKWERTVVAGGKYYINEKNLKKTDWTLYAMIPSAELLPIQETVVKLIVPVAVVMVLITIAMSHFFSRIITSRISTLARQMEAFGGEVPELKEEVWWDYDEIGQLFQSFYGMQKQIGQLVEKEYESGKAVKQAELRALQAQINPHFLYNTLDLINWKALDCGAEQIVEISQSLAKFYKLSLNKGKEFSRISDELAHIRYYVKIQNFRYDNRIHLTEQVAEEVLAYECLHIILQPLVENSFVHGMVERDEDAVLHLTIGGYEEEGDVILKVEDDGRGMSAQQMYEIVNGEADDKKGYGVGNIHNRIRLVYGEGYGLTYLPNSHSGVTVQVRFPKERGQGK